ncbi:high affinity sulfate transporter 1 [Actinocorallia herbida]|uniref:High affinity sulfate transporter 1 n=1 Tax=Actinocorallia herbida TaxID=58109 RepID=A0A3N1CTJ1_9ACTN|nr:sulfate permease [Actinocorallia herbida]ROO84621.1 high affinity sulfate transporter 1 [Actinocorallia herbida]
MSQWWRGYRREWLRGDAAAGVTVAAYLVPQVMAYAAVAGLPPVAGLWAMLPALVAYALFGSSERLSVGPEATTALMTAVVIGPLAGGDPARYAALAAGLALCTGLLAFAARLLRLGFVADLLSHPILVGYLAGVAVVMVSGQLSRVTGVPVEGQGVVAEVVSFAGNITQVHPGTLALSLTCLGFLFALQRWRPHWPGPLLAVLLAAGAVAVFALDERGIAVVGEVPAGLPAPSLPDLSDAAVLLPAALGVLLVSFTDTMLTARAFETPGGRRADGNAELVALGAANAGAGLFQGFPVSSSGSRTALAAAAGARTQAFSLVALACVGAVLLVLNPLLAAFPKAALGALVVYAAARLVDLAGFRRLAAFRRSELLLALSAVAGVLFLDVLYGILVAIGLSVLDLLRRVARPRAAVLGKVPGLAGMHDVADFPDAETVPGLVVYRYDSPLFFANAEDFRRRALAAADAPAERPAWFLLNAEAIIEVDSTALEALGDLAADLARRGIVLALAHVKQDLLGDLRRFGLLEVIPADLIFPTLPTAVGAFTERTARDGA